MPLRRAITGLDPLLQKLARLADQEIRTIAGEATHAAAEPVLATAKELAPELEEELPGHAPPGTLKESLVIKDKTRGKRRISASVETRAGNYKGEEFYGAFVELGHKQGKRPKAGEEDKRQDVAAHPYLEPAFDQNESRALGIIKDRVAAGVERAAAGP